MPCRLGALMIQDATFHKFKGPPCVRGEPTLLATEISLRNALRLLADTGLLAARVQEEVNSAETPLETSEYWQAKFALSIRLFSSSVRLYRWVSINHILGKRWTKWCSKEMLNSCVLPEVSGSGSGSSQLLRCVPRCGHSNRIRAGPMARKRRDRQNAFARKGCTRLRRASLLLPIESRIARDIEQSKSR